MQEIDRFEIFPIEKETIKIRLFFTIIYFKDRVLLREDYIDKVLNEYKRENELEKNEPDIWETTLLVEQLVEIDYRMMLMYLSLICQMFEQFLLNIIIEKLNLQKGIDFGDLNEKFKEYGFDFKAVSSWDKIYELRTLVNVIKHADGSSKNKLIELRPYYFYDNANNMIKNTINDMKLNIKAKDFFEYANAIMKFIDEMPNVYKKEH